MPVTSSSVRIALSVAVVAAAGLLAGCPPTPKPPTTQPTATFEAPAIGIEPVAGGVYESVGTREPLTGEALVRARLSRREILSQVTAKVASGGATTRVATLPAATQGADRAADEPPPLAVKFYLEGREKFLGGANSEAMDFLEKSLKLDPNAFTVLRLMGRVCFAASQLSRGALYLEKAQQLQPADVEVNYLLGRYWLERKDFDRAVYYLMLAVDSPERQQASVQTPLSSFYLARALQAAKYHRAACAEYEHFLDLSSMPVAGYRYDRELAYLIDESWAAHLAAAENAVAIGEDGTSLPHYARASEAQPRDAFIAARFVAALVRTHAPEQARQRSLELVLDTHGSADAITLLVATYRATGMQAAIIRDVSAVLKERDGNADEATTALTIAAVQDNLGQKGAAFGTLVAYLRAHPADQDVLERLFKRVDSAGTFDQALHAAAAAIEANPAGAKETLRSVVDEADGPAASALASDLAKARQGSSDSSYAYLYLRAVVRRLHHAPPDQIAADFERSIILNPSFFPARGAYAAWLLAEEKFTRANELLAAPGVANTPDALELLIQAEVAQHRYASALKLAQEARQQYPTSAELRLLLADVYRLRGQDRESDAELQALLVDNPKFEPAYKALINALLLQSRNPARGGPGREQVLGQIASTLAKLNREIPDSKFGQVNSALFMARGGRFEESEAALARLNAETPDDPDILIPLAQVREARGNTGAALKTLEDSVASRPQAETVRALAQFYNEQDRRADALAMLEKFRKEHSDVEMYVLLNVQQLNLMDRRAEALALLRDGRKKFPRSQLLVTFYTQELARGGPGMPADPHAAAAELEKFIADNGATTERLYSLSHLYSLSGNDDASVAALEKVLAIMPDHPGANNDLGYFWVDAGIHLDEAGRMIRRALDNEPTSAAYQDSLGWLYYKQGNFPEAVKALELATTLPTGDEPEVITHLGDALYRAGRSAEAVERWRQAKELLSRDKDLSKDEQKLASYLSQVLDAVKDGKAPALSSVPDRVEKAAATLPAKPRN